MARDCGHHGGDQCDSCARRTTALKLVRIDPSAANIAALPAHMLQANPNVTGALRFSSAEGMRLFAVAAEEAANGLTVGLNFVAQPASDFLNGVSTEAATGQPELNGSPYSSNVFGWSYMKQVSPSGFGVTHAWQALDYAGKLGNLTTVAIIEDGGFGPNGDFPTFNTISMIPGQMGSFVPNPTPNSEGKPAPWHGTMVAQSLAGEPITASERLGPRERDQTRICSSFPRRAILQERSPRSWRLPR